MLSLVCLSNEHCFADRIIKYTSTPIRSIRNVILLGKHEFIIAPRTPGVQAMGAMRGCWHIRGIFYGNYNKRNFILSMWTY